MKGKLIIVFIIIVVSICFFIYFTSVDKLEIELLSVPLIKTVKTESPLVYQFPNWKSNDTVYYPSNASILPVEQQYIMNIRYIKYNDILNKKITQKTKNLSIFLDSSYKPIGEPTLMSENYEPKGMNRPEGLEDIRLFYHQNQLKCIASCGNITEKKNIVIVIGDYDIKNKLINNIKIIDSPTSSFIEKNWCFIKDEFVSKLNSYESDKMNFIYSWYPLSIGYINNKSLNIYAQIDVPPIFKRFRGSTIVVKDNQNRLWCLVHFTYGYYKYRNTRLTYYHCLVQFEYGTMKPLSITNPFIFFDKGIEYCIGFNIDEMNIASFVVTVNDINPSLIRIPLDTFQQIIL